MLFGRKKASYYKIKTLPKPRLGMFKKFSIRAKRHQQLVVSVLGIYIFAGLLLGSFLFGGTNSRPASASNIASVSSSIRFLEEKDFKLGDKVDVILTLQNASITEPVNNLNINFLSTKDSVKWNLATNQNLVNAVPLASNSSNSFNLPVLGAGERAEYLVSGELKDSSVDYLTILGKINYSNIVGLQEDNTNRVYTSLNSSNKYAHKLLKLKGEKEIYAQNDEVALTLSSPNVEFVPLSEGLKGKVFVSKIGQKELLGSYDCNVDKQGFCGVTLKKLDPADYSALFISEDSQTRSEINLFSVQGKTNNGKLVPSELASIAFPFGAKSVNGLVPVLASRVVSKNDLPENSVPCVFELYKAGALVKSFEVKVDSDRNCQTEISTSQLLGEGVYQVKLGNTNLSKDISFLNEEVGLLDITNQTATTKKGQDLSIKIENIKDETNTPINDMAATAYVYEKKTAKLSNFTSINGTSLKVSNGIFEASIPGNNFENSGNYLVYVQLQNGRLSKFLNLSLNDSELAFSQSGVIIKDYSKLKVGENLPLSLNGILDRDGNVVAGGVCQANFYPVNNSISATTIGGKIKNGVCDVVLSEGKITKSGPVLVTFNSDSQTSSINQSRQLTLASGVPTNYGALNLEFSPAKRNYANNLIIGPVTDKYGNLADSFNNKVVLKKEDGTEIKQLEEINIQNGFAEVLLPASILNEEKINLSLTSSEGVEILSSKITTVDSNSKLILPSIPDTLKNDSDLEIGYNNVDEKDQVCKLKFIKTAQEFLEETATYNKNDNKCELKWQVGKFRDNSKVLVQLSNGANTFSKLVNLENSESSNLFGVYPQIRFNEAKDLEISLLTSPITDQYGIPVKSGEVKWHYNGRITSTPIENGFSRLNILAGDLENKDVRTVLDKRFLDLDLDISASLTSISKTNNLTLFLGNYDVANKLNTFTINEASNFVTSESPTLFAFQTDYCSVFDFENSGKTEVLKSHYQGGVCYVEVNSMIGKNRLLFENNGFNVGSFDFQADNDNHDVQWCGENGTKCNLIQVFSPANSAISATIFDNDKEYQFKSGELENVVKINQNGLNPLKEYLVKISYLNLNNKEVVHYKQILGEKLVD